jgi:hypothetical protein
VVVGDLTPQEDAEWLGRIRSKLKIPCGEFLILGGALEEDIATAISNFEAPDPHFINFSKFRVDQGTYLVELYAFVTSMTMNVGWDGMGIMAAAEQSKESLVEWWETTRPGQHYPRWLRSWLVDEDGGDDLGLVDYLIRLSPWNVEIPLPPLEPHSNWCGLFELRKPNPCPIGIPRSTLAQS